MSAHGVTLAMRAVKAPPTSWVHQHPKPVAVRRRGELIGYRQPDNMTPYVNPAKDRSLPGKDRIRARRAARR